VAVAVAKTAIETGVAQKDIENWDEYIIQLRQRVARVHANYKISQK